MCRDSELAPSRAYLLRPRTTVQRVVHGLDDPGDGDLTAARHGVCAGRRSGVTQRNVHQGDDFVDADGPVAVAVTAAPGDHKTCKDHITDGGLTDLRECAGEGGTRR